MSTDPESVAAALYDRYRYPAWLRRHSLLVGRIARATAADVGTRLADPSAVLAAYLHDIGRSPLLADDPREHNEIAADVLRAEGLAACVEPARRHPIWSVLDAATAPRTLEDKLVYVADRRGGMRVETIEERAADIARRHPAFAADIARAVPLARAIEREVFSGLSFRPQALAARVEVPR